MRALATRSGLLPQFKRAIENALEQASALAPLAVSNWQRLPDEMGSHRNDGGPHHAVQASAAALPHAQSRARARAQPRHARDESTRRASPPFGRPTQLLQRGTALAHAGRLHEAAMTLEASLRQQPTLHEARLWWGLCAARLGAPETALTALTQAERGLSSEASTTQADTHALAAFELANAHFERGNLQIAEQMYTTALRSRPTHAEARSNIGVVHYSASRFAEAAAHFTSALALRPHFADAQQHLGASLKALGAAEEALDAYRRSASMDPSASEPLRGVALVLRERGRLAEARVALHGARLLSPKDSQLLVDLGVTHDYGEQRHEAITAYVAALRLSPPGRMPQALMPKGMGQPGYLLGRACKSIALWRHWDQYHSALSAALASPGGADRLQVDPVASLTSPLRPPQLLSVVRAAVRARLALTDHRVASGGVTLAQRAAVGRQLRIGFVSSYFRDHNLLRLCRSLFLLADPTDFWLALFAESDDDGSPILRQVQAAAARFVRIRSMSTEEAVSRIADENLQVVLNLNGHHWNSASESVRFGLFTPQAAPVAAAFMGYPGPTGAPAIHYTYVDAVAVPPAHAAHFSERLALLPSTYYLNDYKASHPALLGPLAPSVDALPTQRALLCSLNQLPKLDPSLFAVWLNALRRTTSATPRTRLWLLRFPPSAEANLRREAAAHLDPPPPASLLGLDTVDHARHLHRAAHCNLFVDSLLCNAHTSGTDALWAGTPMISLPAENQAARVGASLLLAVGSPESTVSSLRGYGDQVAWLVAQREARFDV